MNTPPPSTTTAIASPTISLGTLAKGYIDEQGKISCCVITDSDTAATTTALHLQHDFENPKEQAAAPIQHVHVAPKRKVQFAEEESLQDGASSGTSSGWQAPPRTPKPKKMDGREWRKRQQMKRRVERRRENYRSQPLTKRFSKLSRALLACIPYYVEDVTSVEDPTAIGSLRGVMFIQLGFSLVLLTLVILNSTSSSALSSATGAEVEAAAAAAPAAAIDPLFFTLAFAIVGSAYLLARKWDDAPPSKMTRALIFVSHLLLVANYAVAFGTARYCPESDPFGYGSGCRRPESDESVGGASDDLGLVDSVDNGNGVGNQGGYGVAEQRMYSLEDCILYGATSACWLLLSCPVYVCISRVRATVLGKLGRLVRMEKAGRAAQKQMRRFSV